MKHLRLIDLHVHTYLCGHATGEPAAYVKTAVLKGLVGIGFSDHLIIKYRKPDYSMALNELPLYISLIEKVKTEFEGVIEVRIGLEIDYFEEEASRLEKIIENLNLDYTLGSVHFLNGWCIDDEDYIEEWMKRDIYKVYEAYFEKLMQAASSGLFNVISHPDLPKVFGFKPKQDITSLLEEVASCLKKAGVCAEVNTSGLRKPCREIYPSEQFLRILAKHGVPVTLGSDAHKPKDVARDFDKAVNLLLKVGYTEITGFKNGKPYKIPIVKGDSK